MRIKVKDNVKKPPIIKIAKADNFTLKASVQTKEFHLYMGNLDVDAEESSVEKCIKESGSGINIISYEMVRSKRFTCIRSIAAYIMIDAKDRQEALQAGN